MFETNSSITSQSSVATAVSCPSVLLVGRNGSWGTSVLKSLEKFGSELSFAAPQTVTPEFVRKGAYQSYSSRFHGFPGTTKATRIRAHRVGGFHFLYFPGGEWMLVAAHACAAGRTATAPRRFAGMNFR